MSSQTPGAHNFTFFRKKPGHPNALRPPKPDTAQGIFKTRLSTSPPRCPGLKANPITRKLTTFCPGGSAYGNESTFLDEDDSLDSEQSRSMQQGLLGQTSDTDDSTSPLLTSSAKPGTISSLQGIPGPPGLPPPALPRYPLIIPTKQFQVPQGAPIPRHWAPGGSCNVRIEPETVMGFMPRPGTTPPPWWTPGGCATRLDKPPGMNKPVPSSERLPTFDANTSYEGDVSQVQDTTVSNGDSSASFGSPSKDRILDQLETISQMDEATLADARLPSVCDSIWATCPTPPPSPGTLSAAHLKRKQSHGLLNYLLVECSFDLGSLNRLTARYPVPVYNSPMLHEHRMPVAAESSYENITIKDSMETLDTLDYNRPMDALEKTVEVLKATLPAPNIMCNKIPLHYPDPPRCPLPLTRTRSLPEGWKISQFMRFTRNSRPPSLAPPSKPKRKTLYQLVIESAEFIAAPPQSGHGYLQANGIAGKKLKQKTRPTEASTIKPTPAAPGVTLNRTTTGTSIMKPSLLSRVLRRRDPNHEDPKEEQKPGVKWFSKLSKMSKATTDQMRVLFKGNGNAARELSWTAFLTIMEELGFTWKSTGGNTYKFYPQNPSDPTIVFSRPSGKVFHKRQLAEIRKKLLGKYEWNAEEISAALGA